MSDVISESEPDFAAFIAIDWADREHTWSLQVDGSPRRETGTFEQTPEAIEAWAMQWAARFPGRPVAVALEQSRGALVYPLSQYPHLVLFPIHPSTSSDYRKALFPSGSKDDPKDTDVLLDLLICHRNRLRALHPDTIETRKLQLLVQKRRELVDQRTAETNRMRDLLKLYFPQILDWFDEMSAPMLADFLRRWPTLPEAQQAPPEDLRKFFHQHNSRSEARIQERLTGIRQARPLLEDRAVVEPAVLMVGALLGVVAALQQGISEMDRAIAAAFAAHPDQAIFASFPGAGPVLAPRLLAAFGSQRDRYAQASDLQSFSGIAPVTSSSGGQEPWIHFRYGCPKFLRQSFHEYAAQSLLYGGWAKQFYDSQIAAGSEHHAAVRALAYKWIRIQFACWKSGRPYDEQIYLKARARRPCQPTPENSGRKARRRRGKRARRQAPAAPKPVVTPSAQPVELQIKTVAGFGKLAAVRA